MDKSKVQKIEFMITPSCWLLFIKKHSKPNKFINFPPKKNCNLIHQGINLLLEGNHMDFHWYYIGCFGQKSNHCFLSFISGHQ
ncbi:hypothetical protein D2V93_16320 [Flagellimonas taeanensis]|nr:hypothetical protein D2V93_16320 [Allomuricauda taeanensis]